MLKHFNEFGFFDKLAVHMSSNHLIICYILGAIYMLSILRMPTNDGIHDLLWK